jgi:hypothetical protein
MKGSRIFINALIIYICIGVFFIIMEQLGWADIIYLRLINFIFVFYGVNRTVRSNFKDNINGYFTNLGAAFLTAFVSLVLSVFSLMLYLEAMGGERHMETYAGNYIFGGGDPSPYQFGIGLFIEGLAACAIVSFVLMQFWKDKVEKINAVDDAAHNPH